MADEDIKSLQEKFNQASRIRYQILKRKIAMWDEIRSFSTRNFAEKFPPWLERFCDLTRKEIRIVTVFRIGVDEATELCAEYSKKVIAQSNSSEEKRDAALLVAIFASCDELVKAYERRVKKESQLLEKEQKHRLHNFVKKMHEDMIAEIRVDLEFVRLLGKERAELDRIKQNIELIDARRDSQKFARTAVGGGAGIPGAGLAMVTPVGLVSFIVMVGVWFAWSRQIENTYEQELKSFVTHSEELEKLLKAGFL